MHTKRRSWPAWLLLLALLTVFFVWFLLKAKPAEGSRVQRQALSQTLVASGRITTPARIALGSEVVATVHAVYVREGDMVHAGDLLLQLRADEADAVLAEAQAALQHASLLLTEVQQLDNPVSAQLVRQAEAELQLAQREHRRTQELVEKGFFASATLDVAERSLATAEATLLSAQTRHRATGTGGASVAVAQARWQQAQASLVKATAQRAQLSITAPVAGTITLRSAEAGDVAQAGSTLLELAQAGEVRIHATLDEKNLPLLREGMAAHAVADAFPHQPFAAHLYYLAPAVDAQRATVELRLAVADPPNFLRPDMTASVEILAAEKTDALVVPADLVRDAATPTPWVLVLRDGIATQQPVQLGLRGIGLVELATGVQAGEWVLSPEAGLVAGQRAKPAETAHAH